MTDRATLQSQATQIRDETILRANTATRVGAMLKNLADSAALTVDVATYGASPTKTAAENQTAFQEAYNAVRDAGGGTVTIGIGQYALSGNVVMYANTRTVMEPGTVLDISASGSVDCLRADGTEGATMALTANASKGATSISLSAPNAATLAQGDWFRLASNALFDSSNTDSEIGEICLVASVSGTTVTLEAPLRGGAYNTADSAVASKITFVENIVVTGGRVLGGGTVTTAGVDADCNGVRIFLGKDCRIEGTEFTRCDLNGVWLRDCVFCQVSRCNFSDAINDTQAYGVSFDNACQDCIIEDCTGTRVRHLVTTANSTATKGITRRIRYSGCKVFSTSTARGGSGGDAFDTHGGCEDVYIEDCTVYSSTGSGINIEGASISIANCEIYYATEYGIHVHNETDQEGVVSVTDCKVDTTGIEGIRVSMGFRGTVAVNKSVKVVGNQIANAVSIGLYCPAAANSLLKNRNYTIQGNIITGCQSSSGSVYLEDIENGVVTGNVVAEPTTSAPQFRTRDCINVLVEQNTVRNVDSSAAGISYWINSTAASGCQKIVFQGNRAGGATPSGLRGLLVDALSAGCRIGQNDFQECNTPYQISGGYGHTFFNDPGVSADNGNASVTLTVNSQQVQRFSTPLTVARNVTLPTGIVGLRYRVLRQGGATGADLTIASGALGTLGPTATGSYIDLDSDISGAWHRTSFQGY